MTRSIGPTLDHAKKHVVAGQFNSPKVTLEADAPRGATIAALHVAAHVQSGNPPRPDVKYQIEKARQADQLAGAEDDPELRGDWIKIAAFWLGLAERAMEEKAEKRRPLGGSAMH